MKNLDFEIRIPKEVANSVIQEEFFWLNQNGKESKVRLHDYAQMYGIPYLYEHVMNKLEAKSHIVLSSLLVDCLSKQGGLVEDLVVLEVGAGSGMVGKALADLGVKSIVGIDIMPQAKVATERENPGVYENYYVEDLSKLSSTTRENLSTRGFNCIVCGSALGFNHIPSETWATAYNLIAPNGLVAFNIQKERWEDKGEASFAAWHPWVAEANIFQIVETYDYQHRFYMDGRSLEYVAVIGIKKANISEH